MDYKKRVLLIRLSALGDVAILEPVLRRRAASNPDVLFLLAAPPVLQPLFTGIPNLQYVPTQKKQSVWNMFRFLYNLAPSVVLDMHKVNRTVLVDWLFRICGVPVYALDKHKSKRRRMVRRFFKDRTSDVPVWKRYDLLFSKIGLNGEIAVLDSIPSPVPDAAQRRVGVAPFAQHKGKIWPPELMFQLLELMCLDGKYQVFLFGSRSEAAQYLDKWAQTLPNLVCVAGRHSFAEEMNLIASLDLMVTMDSANMHFASCKQVPVVSVWGATHPRVGFYGFSQNEDWAVQSDMYCRPCSAFGNKPCRFGDYPCLRSISPKLVFDRVEKMFSPDHSS